MNANKYQELAMRTINDNATGKLNEMIYNIYWIKSSKQESQLQKCDFGNLLNGCLGLSGEVGEFNDIVKKWVFQGGTFDEEAARKEIGDVLWYVALICHSMGWFMNDIMRQNINKLKSRYPEGFSEYRSEHRIERISKDDEYYKEYNAKNVKLDEEKASMDDFLNFVSLN